MPSGITPLALRRTDRHAQIGLAAQAVLALPAFRRVERDDVIALLQRRHAGSNLRHDASALMAEDRRKQPLRIGAGERIFIRVADAGRLDLDQHLAGTWPLDIHGLQAQRLARLAGYRGSYLHRIPPS